MTLAIQNEVNVAVKVDTSHYEEAAKKAANLSKQFSFGISDALDLAVDGVRLLNDIMLESITLAQAQEEAEKKLEAALGRRSQTLLNQASVLQETTVYGDEAIIGTQASIAALVKEEEQIKAATQATLDFAAATGMGLTEATDLVTQTLGTSTNALSGYGITVEGAVGSTERLDTMTTEMANKFGGQAAAETEKYTGKLQQLSNKYGTLKEQIGFAVVESGAFDAIMNTLGSAIDGLTTFIADNKEGIGGYAKELEGIGMVGSEAFRAFLSIQTTSTTAVKELVSSLVNAVSEGLGIDIPKVVSEMGGVWGLMAKGIAGSSTLITIVMDATVAAVKHVGNAFITLNDVVAKTLLFGTQGSPLDAMNAGLKRGADIQKEYLELATEKTKQFEDTIKRIDNAVEKGNSKSGFGTDTDKGIDNNVSKGCGTGVNPGVDSNVNGPNIGQLESRMDALRKSVMDEKDVLEAWYAEQLDLVDEYYANRADKEGEAEFLRIELAKEYKEKLDEINGVPAMEKELQALRDHFKSEEDLTKERYDKKLKDLQTWLDNDIIKKTEYIELEKKLQKEKQDELTKIEEKGATAREKFAALSFDKQADYLAGYLKSTTSDLAKHNKAMFEMNKAAGIAQAIISTYQGAAKVIEKLGMPWAIPFVAATVAAGMAQVNAIASTSFNGGGKGGAAPSAASSTTATSVSDVSQTPVQTNAITVYGIDKNSLYSGDQIEAIAEGLNEYMADGGKIYIK